ncbi:hypothetical protein DL1_20755 [Thioclava dalianensis]|uniref:UrcA family protein n=1 Tax=Thioclava dalianensis TaxID=1185766 RepID=A0A074TDZ2_9RHOB|nr:hypothetical protein [Thioclava dalianensis]KEP69991.1 hypothetical protein DL1_20755 [Thioclava dalianensis]SFN17451.1 hypothetical protein SAMN05216224_102798 [Thioclava dalianensis]
MAMFGKIMQAASAYTLSVALAGPVLAGDLRELPPVDPQIGAQQAVSTYDPSPYDPVAHALAIGLTPARADAMIDRAMRQAQSCPMVFDTRYAIPHCWEGTLQVGS